MKYNFALETVLRARRAQESVARADLLRANLASAAAEMAQGASVDHYEEVIRANGLTFFVHRQVSELAARSVIEARGALTEAQAGVEAALESYLVAARSVSVLEHLDERRRQEHAAAVAREDANLVDDLVTSRHVRAKMRAAQQAGRQQ
jgi:flagellar biosynthesis chaperone FliJ